jgi:DNA-binding FadR family transcriptional regulator
MPDRPPTLRPAPARTRRYEHIVRAIEQAMLAGEIAPGDRLPSERDLMARFGSGRGTVREALIALKRMGLVSLSAGERACAIQPSAGALVRELSGAARRLLAAPDGMRHFQQSRRLLECAIAAEAARAATPVALARLEAALAANRAAPDLPKAIATDVEFHYRIAEMTGNPVLTALHAALGEWLREQRTTSVAAPEARERANLAHEAIYAAIAAADPAAASAAMQRHLEEVEAFYWQAARPPAGEAPAPTPALAPARRGARARR